MNPVIELRKVSKIFGKGEGQTPALRDVSLVVRPGEFVAIMGPSGSGKSTLLNILGLLDVPTAGEYLLDGQPTHKLSQGKQARMRRERIGFVFQTFNLLNRLSLLQNVELPMIYRGLRPRARRARARQLLTSVGLKDRIKYKPNQISGGETQRAAVARALANQPSLILADEPTGNLDTKSSALVMNQLRQLHASGVTVVVITHNPEVAQYAQRTVVIRDGRVVSAASHAPEGAAAKPRRRL